MSDHEQKPEVERENDEPVEPTVEPEIKPEIEPEIKPEIEPEVEPEDEARAPTVGQLKRFETENTRHEKQLAKIVGRDWEGFAPCAECGGVGFVPAATLAVPELVEVSNAIECPACKGHGRQRTPSRVPGQETQVCIECAGNGWKRELPATEREPAFVPPVPGNGGTNPYPGHILVKVDPNAPDVAFGAPAHATVPPAVPA